MMTNNFKKGQIARVVDDDAKARISFFEVLLLGKNLPDFQGEVIAVNPSPEEFAALDPNFAGAVEAGEYTGEEQGVVIFDKGANRAFWFEPHQLELVTVN